MSPNGRVEGLIVDAQTAGALFIGFHINALRVCESMCPSDRQDALAIRHTLTSRLAFSEREPSDEGKETYAQLHPPPSNCLPSSAAPSLKTM